jgi:hypothetical protein
MFNNEEVKIRIKVKTITPWNPGGLNSLTLQVFSKIDT